MGGATSRGLRACRATRCGQIRNDDLQRIVQLAEPHTIPPHAVVGIFGLVGGCSGACDGPCPQWLVARMLCVHVPLPPHTGRVVLMGAMLGAWWPMLEIYEP